MRCGIEGYDLDHLRCPLVRRSVGWRASGLRSCAGSRLPRFPQSAAQGSSKPSRQGVGHRFHALYPVLAHRRRDQATAIAGSPGELAHGLLPPDGGFDSCAQREQGRGRAGAAEEILRLQANQSEGMVRADPSSGARRDGLGVWADAVDGFATSAPAIPGRGGTGYVSFCFTTSATSVGSCFRTSVHNTIHVSAGRSSHSRPQSSPSYGDHEH